VGVGDRLRELIDVVVSSLDERVDGTLLAQRVHFSRDHLDRLLAAATGESPVALRRRLLLERAAWQLRTGAASAADAAAATVGNSPSHDSSALRSVVNGAVSAVEAAAWVGSLIR
jgi:transcriptional regulator GlxA family with amidase domain